MNAIAIAAPILPGKTEDWKTFSYDLDKGAQSSEYSAFIKSCGLSRVRCWLHEIPGGDIGIILYEGETPGGFAQKMAMSQEPFAVWFRERVMELHGMDMTQPGGPPPMLVTDVSAD
jgi:hypothetical protein